MSCRICGSDAHLEADNWQCATFFALLLRVAALEDALLEKQPKPVTITEGSSNG